MNEPLFYEIRQYGKKEIYESFFLPYYTIQPLVVLLQCIKVVQCIKLYSSIKIEADLNIDPSTILSSYMWISIPHMELAQHPILVICQIYWFCSDQSEIIALLLCFELLDFLSFPIRISVSIERIKSMKEKRYGLIKSRSNLFFSKCLPLEFLSMVQSITSSDFENQKTGGKCTISDSPEVRSYYAQYLVRQPLYNIYIFSQKVCIHLKNDIFFEQ